MAGRISVRSAVSLGHLMKNLMDDPDTLAAKVLQKHGSTEKSRDSDDNDDDKSNSRMDEDARYITRNMMDAMHKKDEQRFTRSLRQLFDLWQSDD